MVQFRQNIWDNAMKITQSKFNGSFAEIVVEAKLGGSRLIVQFEASRPLQNDAETDPLVAATDLSIEEISKQCKISDAEARAMVVTYLLKGGLVA